MQPVDVAALDQFTDLATRRRTSLVMDRESPVPDDLVAHLCRVATWAPNHKKTWPWRFAVLTGAARARLGELARAQMLAEGVTDEAKLDKALGKYLRAPTVLLVASAAHEDPVLHAENRDAVAASIQNILLGATAAGLASFWASGAVLRSAAVKELAGFDPTDRIVGLVYLGWPTGRVEAPTRPEPPISFVSG